MLTTKTRTIATAAALWLTTVAVRATVVVPADLVDLAAGARAIAHGRVTATEARWAEGRRHVETLVRVEVGAYLKGNLGREVTVRVPGGDLGTYRTVVVGAPRFVEGDEVVLFLGGEGPAIPYLVGLSAGVFRVVTDRQGRRVVVPPALTRGPTAQRVTRGDPLRGPLGVGAFEDAVKAALDAGPLAGAAPAGARAEGAR